MKLRHKTSGFRSRAYALGKENCPRRCPLSRRGRREDLLAERGLIVSNEAIRRWVLKFGPVIAKNLRAIRPKAYTRWHLDEIVVSLYD